jgi:hypothetical protein
MECFPRSLIFRIKGSYIEITQGLSPTFNAEQESAEIELMGPSILQWKGNKIVGRKMHFLEKE